MYYFYCIARFLSLNFPRRISYAIARFLSRLKISLAKNDRETMEYNLLPVAGNARLARRYSREVFDNFAFYLVDFFRFVKINAQFIADYVTIEGIEFLDESLAARQGVIIVSAHLGNYEFGAGVTSFLGYTVNAVAFPHKDKRINSIFNSQRNVFGINVIPTGTAVRQCFEILKKGGIVALLGDRDLSYGKGEEVRLCGHRMLLPRGAASFARKTGARIVPSFFIREEKYRYRLVFEKNILPYSEREVSKTTHALVQEYALVLERYIKKYPQQWYMFERCWLGQ